MGKNPHMVRTELEYSRIKGLDLEKVRFKPQFFI